MKFLRTVSTRRLLAVIAGVLVVVIGGTAIAVAASGNGPVPKAESLADAIHGGLSGPKVTGVTADISFTDHLIDASELQGSDPLLNGATGRLWYSPSTQQLRLELQSTNGDTQIVLDKRSFWISDPGSNTVYEGTLPSDKGSSTKPQPSPDAGKVPTVAQIQTELSKLAQHLNISGAIPGDDAGQPAYSVRVSPKHDGGLLGSAQLAFDAIRGVPLDFSIFAANSTTPVLELKADNISYGAVPSSDFAVSPPAGDKVVRISTPASAAAGTGHSSIGLRDHGKPVTGLSAVAKTLPFTLAAPSTLAGLPRATVAKLDWGGSPASVVTYGEDIGGIAVIERKQDGAGNSASRSGLSHGASKLTLPTVSIDGITGQELDTALGTVITFSRSGVDYTVLGSVTPTAAEAAADAVAKSL